MISFSLLERFAFSDEYKWFLEIEEPLEPFIVLTWEEFIRKSKTSPSKVCIDKLEVRANVFCELIRTAQKNIPYLIGLGKKLRDKCELVKEFALAEQIQIAILTKQQRMKELEQKTQGVL